MELNKKELKKIMYSFSTISSRMMRVSYDEYNIVLNKFLAFIDETDIIMDYILTGKDEEFNAEEDFNKVASDDYIFSFGPTIEKESYQIYEILKYIQNNIKSPYYSFFTIYRKKHWQDNVKIFNDRVVLVLINNIDEYLTKVGIDMGLDENVTWNVSGGQVNVASGNATINATQNNGNINTEFQKIIENIQKDISKLDEENAETVRDAVEFARQGFAGPEPKINKLRSCITLISPILAIANGIPTLGTNLQKLVSYIAPYLK